MALAAVLAVLGPALVLLLIENINMEIFFLKKTQMFTMMPFGLANRVLTAGLPGGCGEEKPAEKAQCNVNLNCFQLVLMNF